MTRLRLYQETVLFWMLAILLAAFSLPFIEVRTTPSRPLQVVRFHEPPKDGGPLNPSR